MMTSLLALLILNASAQTCPAVSAQEVTAALASNGEAGAWAVDGPVQPYPNVPYFECHYFSKTGKLNRQVLIQVRPAEGAERTSLKHFVDQVSKTASVPPRAVAGLGDEAWFYVDAEGAGQLNVRSGSGVVHVNLDLQVKGSADAERKLRAAQAIAGYAVQRLKSGEISVTKR
jgi:hypothetical protein